MSKVIIKEKEVKESKEKEETRSAPKKSGSFSNLGFSVPIQDQILFARHLSVMAKAGLPLLESLKLIQKESTSRSMLKILDQVIKDVSNGQFLAASLERYENIFGSLFINIIRVGESTGILSENLNYLANELKKKAELRKKVIGALIYPSVILVATLGITALLTLFIFPKILPIFKTMKVELPATTKALIWFSDFLSNNGLWVLIGGVVVIITLWITGKIDRVRYFYHWLILKLPIFGAIARGVSLASFCRTLGLTLKSGVRVVEAITITGNSLGNVVYRKKVLAIADSVQKGETITEHLNKEKKLFPIVVTQMVSVGETAGNLSETLLYLSDFYEGEVDETTKNLSNVLEPFLMVLMGAIVGFVAISIITPIYEVSQGLSG